MGKRSARTQNEDESQSRKRQRLKETEPECGQIGIIESVTLINFMCHENLSFEFGPNINFIIGKNGSGKSAILTGIILALGGRSSVTGRYSNFQGFIKEGKQKAKIEVVLRNRGDHPYKPDLYGTKVTVVREISLDGVSSYKLKSAAGSVVSGSKEELKNILKAMDIQIENPVSLLTQENSRSFLTSNKPDKLYQFFYQGSGLEMLEKSYSNVHTNYEEAAAELQRKKEMLPGMEKDLKAWKKIIETSTQIDVLKQELLWAGIIKMEKQLQQKEEEFQKALKDEGKNKRELEIRKNKLDERTSSLVELEKKRESCQATMSQELRRELGLLNEKHYKLSNELRVLEGKYNSSRREETTTRDEMLRIQNTIKESSQRNQSSLDEEKRLREMKIQTLKEHCEKCVVTLKELDQTRQRQMESRNDIYRKGEGLVIDIRSCTNTLKDYERMLIHSQNALKNKVNVFGDQTQNVLDEIKRQAKQFSQPPKGPIGMYLEVKDSKWCDAVEECISAPVLQGYCCDNVKDSLVLTEILKKFYPQNRPSVIISKYVTKLHEVSQFRPQTDFPTVFEMLRISDPVIANILVDTACIESKVLIEDTDSGVAAMVKNPKNCLGAILVDCSTIGLYPYRFYSSGKRSRKSLLASIGESNIEDAKRLVAKTQSTLDGLQSKRNALQALANETNMNLNVTDKKIIQTNLEMKRSSQEMQDLLSFQDPKDTQCVEEDLEHLESEYNKIQIEVQKYDLCIKEQRQSISHVLKDIDKYKKRLNEEKEQFDEICSDLNSCAQEKEMLSSAVKKFSILVKAITDKLEPLKREIEEDRRYTETAVRAAEEVGPRIDTDRSQEVLEALLGETNRIVKEQSNCDREELILKYKEKLETLQKAKNKLAEKEKQFEHIAQMYKRRRRHFKNICHYTESIINLAYTLHLSKYYDGRLEFDNQAKKLILKASAAKTGAKKNQGGGNCSSLSGGERSFVTIAFLLAMWDRIKSPFKILDEYDVFMDSNNRNLSIGLLTEQANTMKDSQFIFLSPLDLPEIKHSPNTKVHQMHEPKRDENASL